MVTLGKQVSSVLGMFITSALLAAQPVHADSVDSAYRVCAVFDGTGLLSEPCSVSGWHSSVDVKMDTSGTEAQKICRGVTQMIWDKGVRFDPGWKLRIYSPFSGDSTIAQCGFR